MAPGLADMHMAPQAIFNPFFADFVLLEKNPLENIRHASGVRGVFTQGRWHSAAELAVMLAEAKELFGSCCVLRVGPPETLRH